jgi:tetratricopeptide (TPR) repeat protein
LPRHGGRIYEPAIAELQRAVQVSNGHPLYISALGQIYAAAGRKDEALHIIEKLKDLSKQQYVMPFWIACVYANLEENDQAFQWLEKA